MREITIVVLLDENPFARSGASSNRWRGMIEALAGQGLRLELLFIGGYLDIKEYRQFGPRGFANGFETIRYRYLGLGFGGNIWMRRLQKYALNAFAPYFVAKRVSSSIREIKPDVLFLYPSLQVFRIVRHLSKHRLNGMKLMLELNEYDDVRNEHATSRLQVWLNNAYRRMLRNFIFPQLDLCIVMTRQLLTYYSGFPNLKDGIRFFHLPMSVDMRRFTEVLDSVGYQKPYVAYCGSSSFKKDGVDVLIRAFDLIAPSFPDLHLYIAAFWESDGPAMTALIEASKCRDRIGYVGVLNRSEVINFISHASICALPRPNSRQAEGGFPTKLGEYLGTANPVCVTSVGEIGDYLKDGISAFLAAPGDVDAFASALRRALMDPENARRVGMNGKLVAKEHFDIYSHAGPLAAFVKEAVSAG